MLFYKSMSAVSSVHDLFVVFSLLLHISQADSHLLKLKRFNKRSHIKF